MDNYTTTHCVCGIIWVGISFEGLEYGSVALRVSCSYRYGCRICSASQRFWTWYICYDLFTAFYAVTYRFFNKSIKLRPSFANGVLAGTLGGTLGGLFSTGGPPAVLYLSSATKDNITYFATIQFYFCFTNLYTTIMRLASGIINVDILIYAAVGMIGCIIGDSVGKIVFDKLDSNKLKYIIYIGMIISGIVMIL